nr:trypsin, alkaline B-like isoform X1 [Danaus plexippus plexippus]
MWRAGVLFLAFFARAQDVLQVADFTTPDVPNTRIIGGNNTSIEKYPYTVQILYDSQLSCGGALITSRHVLTAAHCFVASNGKIVSPRYFTVRAGSTYLDRGGNVYSVSAITVHGSYNTPVRSNDIAIVTLSKAVNFTSSVRSAVIASPGAVVPDNGSVVAVGWGRTTLDGPESQVLQAVEVFKVSQQECSKRYDELHQSTNSPFPVTDGMICAGLLDVGGKDACQGDSGGPLIHRGVVVGLSSWGYSCAQPYFPGVYTRVATYATWINSTINNSGYRHFLADVSLLITLLLTVSSLFTVSLFFS